MILIFPHEPDPRHRVRLTDGRADHIRTVLRATPGKPLRVGLLNGPTGCGTVESLSPTEVVLACDFSGPQPPRPTIDLLLALPRPKVLKRLWAQLAALGVDRIFLTNAEKVERFYFDSHVLDPDFYTERLVEGLQQAGDTQLPAVQVVKKLRPFLDEELAAVAPGRRLLADPSGAQGVAACFTAAAPRPERTLLAVGPEGGWTPYELELFAAQGFTVFHAGPRILRTDTACVALLAALAVLSAPNEY